LTSLLEAPAITYSSGLSAFFALLTYIRPRVIAISDGYHGCHGVIALHTKLYGLRTVPLNEPSAWDAAGLGAGDLVHVETPLNPTGEATDLAHYAALARARGALLSVDATFGPPPLQRPLALGAHVVMHSGTKFLGGHSDMLCGVLATVDQAMWKGLWAERIYLGSVMGSLEGWLGVRSVRTLELRVERQSASATKLALWLHGCLVGKDGDGEDGEIIRKTVKKVQHASIQALDEKNKTWIEKQMPRGYGPVFAMMMESEEFARAFPSKLKFFHHATSLGGVESLIEWRRMSDKGVDSRLLRVSVGVEGWEDLKTDLLDGMKSLV
jgi:cystathionine beta-lyase/cystathionine gamma-synthase